MRVAPHAEQLSQSVCHSATRLGILLATCKVSALGALAQCPRDRGVWCGDVELCLDVLETFVDGVEAEEKLAGEFLLAFDRGGDAQHLALARGQPKASERLGPKGMDL